MGVKHEQKYEQVKPVKVKYNIDLGYQYGQNNHLTVIELLGYVKARKQQFTKCIAQFVLKTLNYLVMVHLLLQKVILLKVNPLADVVNPINVLKNNGKFVCNVN